MHSFEKNVNIAKALPMIMVPSLENCQDNSLLLHYFRESGIF